MGESGGSPGTPTQGKGSGGVVGGPCQEACTQGRPVQAPLEKGRFHGFQHGHSSGRMTAPYPPPPSLSPEPLGAKGTDWVSPSHGQEREVRRERPASCSRLHPENLRASLPQGQRLGQRARPRWWVGEGGEAERAQRRLGKAAANLRKLTWVQRHREQHVRAADPHARRGARAQLGRETAGWAQPCPQARPPPVPGDQDAEGTGSPDLRCPCPPSHLLLGPRLPQGGTLLS